jgi:hypothetical protein
MSKRDVVEMLVRCVKRSRGEWTANGHPIMYQDLFIEAFERRIAMTDIKNGPEEPDIIKSIKSVLPEAVSMASEEQKRKWEDAMHPWWTDDVEMMTDGRCSSTMIHVLVEKILAEQRRRTIEEIRANLLSQDWWQEQDFNASSCTPRPDLSEHTFRLLIADAIAPVSNQ